MSLNIAFVSSSPIFGGGESNLCYICTKLSSLGYDCTLFAHPNLEQSFINSRCRFVPFILSSRTWLKGVDLVTSPAPYSLFIDQWNCFDLIHAHHSDLLPVLKFSNTPIIYTCHGSWDVTTAAKARKICSICQLILAPSSDVISKLRRLDLYAHLSPLGIPILPAIPKENVCSSILCVGRFQPIKGQHLLVLSLIYLYFFSILPPSFLG